MPDPGLPGAVTEIPARYGSLSFRIFSGRFATENELNRVPFSLVSPFGLGSAILQHQG